RTRAILDRPSAGPGERSANRCAVECALSDRAARKRSKTALLIGKPAKRLVFGLGFGIRLEPFFLHFAEDVAHVVDFIPNFLADVNRRFLLGGDSDAIAWPRVQLDDLFLLQFVFRPNNRSRIV